MWSVGRENKTERCVECEGRTKHRVVLSGNGEQNREMCLLGRESKTERCGEWEGRAKQRDVVRGKGKQNREMC